MKKLGVLFGLMFLASWGVKAQDQLTEVYSREHIPNKTPVPYEYIREADVMWSKVVYRMIDLRQKQNLPLYYPTKPIGDRMSLVDLLLYGIDNEGIRAFSTDDPLNEFTAQLTLEDINRKFDAGIDTIITTDPITGELIPQVIEKERQTDQVKLILLKEKWFFDKNASVMKVRIVGICPIRAYFRLDDSGMPTETFEKKQTMWIYFPEVRPLLANHEVFNRFNDSQRTSFDDFFMQRRFASSIFAISNVYDNRWISSYTVGVDAMLESENLKQWMFELEHDLWEY